MQTNKKHTLTITNKQYINPNSTSKIRGFIKSTINPTNWKPHKDRVETNPKNPRFDLMRERERERGIRFVTYRVR
jgi:DUF438 domain-containing protein